MKLVRNLSVNHAINNGLAINKRTINTRMKLVRNRSVNHAINNGLAINKRTINTGMKLVCFSVKFQPSGRVPSTVSGMKRVTPPVICASPAKPVVVVTR